MSESPHPKSKAEESERGHDEGLHVMERPTLSTLQPSKCQACKLSHEYFIRRDNDPIAFGKVPTQKRPIGTIISSVAADRVSVPSVSKVMTCKKCMVQLCLPCIEDDNLIHPIRKSSQRAGSLKSTEKLDAMKNWQQFNMEQRGKMKLLQHKSL